MLSDYCQLRHVRISGYCYLCIERYIDLFIPTHSHPPVVLYFPTFSSFSNPFLLRYIVSDSSFRNTLQGKIPSHDFDALDSTTLSQQDSSSKSRASTSSFPSTSPHSPCTNPSNLPHLRKTIHPTLLILNLDSRHSTHAI